MDSCNAVMWQNKYSKDLLLSAVEEDMLYSFVASAREKANRVGILDESWRLPNIALEAKISIVEVSKAMLAAMWIEFLEIVRIYLSPESFKYQSVDAFLYAYTNHSSFTEYSTDEQITLMEIANWMNILFFYGSAKKKKGLIIEVVPRLVEGPDAKYITGSGQTQATADRVLIYEIEGGVKPAIRLKRRKAAELKDDDLSYLDPIKRTRRSKGARSSVTAPIDLHYNNPRHLFLYNKLPTPLEDPTQDLTDVDSDHDVDSTAVDTGLGHLRSHKVAGVDACCCISLQPLAADRNLLGDVNGIDQFFPPTTNSIHAGFIKAYTLETVQEQPVLVRQLTDHAAWIETLMELGGPVRIDSDLDPLIFYPDLLIDD